MIVTPLYGHVSPETAYLVADYPYGRRVRCRIRYWIEQSARHGYRFVSQTEHPTSLRWNAPKRGQYVRFAMAMYLNEDGHVKHWGVGEYIEKSEAVLSFIRDFPQADVHELKPFIVAKLVYCRRGAAGEVRWTINGVVQPVEQRDVDRYAAELPGWEAVAVALGLMAQREEPAACANG